MNINDFTPLRQGEYPRFVSSENGVCHVGINSNKDTVRHYHLDGDVWPHGDGAMKCDFLLLNDSIKRAYFIELKGDDVERAILQIERAVKEIQESIKGYIIYRRIIYKTRTHRLKASALDKWTRKYRPYAKAKNNRLEESICYKK